ncbi:MAG: hypothetical protein O2954_00895, partial [bacterium]|nr:hypothetical protein [bacterium]
MNIEKTLKRLRRLLEADDFCLTDRVYEGTKRLFFSCSGDPGLHAELMAHTGEYLRDEFLLNTDGTGAAFEPPESVQEDYRKVCNLRPGFTRWFREVSGEAG